MKGLQTKRKNDLLENSLPEAFFLLELKMYVKYRCKIDQGCRKEQKCKSSKTFNLTGEYR